VPLGAVGVAKQLGIPDGNTRNQVHCGIGVIDQWKPHCRHNLLLSSTQSRATRAARFVGTRVWMIRRCARRESVLGWTKYAGFLSDG